MRTLPGATRNGGGALPAPSHRRTVIPTPSHRLLTARDVPPLPQFRVFVAADALAIVQPSVKVRVTARATATVAAEVTASAAVRADGGRKFVDADHDVTVTASAAAYARYQRTATATVSVAAAADAGAGARPQFGATVTAAAVVNSVRTALAAVKDASITASAEIVAYGGQVAVDAEKSTEVTATAGSFGRIYRDAAVSIEATATAQRVIRMAAAAAQSATVSASAGIQVPVTAQASVAVTASATARLAFDNSGMTKSGTQVAGTSYTLLAPWVVRSGFTTTVIEDNGIRVPAGVTVNITYRVPFDAQPGPSSSTYSRLTNDGVEIPGSVVSNTGYSDAPALTLTNLVGTGGIVRVEAYGNSTTSRRTVTAAAYIEIVRV